PGPGEVAVEVWAAGLNFRDVMNAVAMRDDSEPLGGECSGRVVAVGEGVTGLAPGDAVVALGTGCFATRFVVDARLVTEKTGTRSYAAAAALVLVAMTAS